VAEQTEEVEQYARKLWKHRSYNFLWQVEDACGYPRSRYPNRSLVDLEWEQLPDGVKDHVREMAAKEVAAMQGPASEIEQYLITMLRELERLHPTRLSAASHGIVWDDKWERLLLLVNLGDVVYPHPLHPGDLTSDPIATAASLWEKVKPELQKPDHDSIGFKR
jgi:hypothetical protein